MIARLPRWVLIGAGVLAFVAGVVNAVGFLGVAHQAITHLTGTTTQVGIAIATGDTGGVLHLGGVVLAFLAGAMLSGVIIGNSALRLGRRYGVVLTLESALLLVAMILLDWGSSGGDLLASAACGLQNAMASSYSGAVLRTTHLSGTITDIGILLGHWLARLPVDIRRLRLLCLLVFGFASGAVVGSLLFTRYGYAALYLPIVLTGFTGASYWLFRHLRPDPLVTASTTDT